MWSACILIYNPHGEGLEALRETFIKAENEFPVDELTN